MFSGKAGEPPEWLVIYDIAKEFGIAPWDVEENCTMRWRKQFSEYQSAYNQEMKRRKKKSKK